MCTVNPLISNKFTSSYHAPQSLLFHPPSSRSSRRWKYHIMRPDSEPLRPSKAMRAAGQSRRCRRNHRHKGESHAGYLGAQPWHRECTPWARQNLRQKEDQGAAGTCRGLRWGGIPSCPQHEGRRKRTKDRRARDHRRHYEPDHRRRLHLRCCRRRTQRGTDQQPKRSRPCPCPRS